MIGTGVSPWAVIAGLGFGAGIVLLLADLPRFRRPSASERIAPFLVDVVPEARPFAEAARRAAGSAPRTRGTVGDAADRLRGLLRPGPSVALRLDQAASSWTSERFRMLQLVASAIAGLALAGAALAVGATRHAPPPTALGVGVAAAVCAFLVADSLLTRAAARRRARLAEEFPTVAELLAMSLSAGEGAYDAIGRVAAACSGELGAELRRVTADTRVGIPLLAALERMRTRVAVPSVSRLVEAVAAAAEHGAPLAETLRAQASDARAERKRELLESAGRKELAMLVPLVFLILPLTVLIAVFPGVYVLRTGL